LEVVGFYRVGDAGLRDFYLGQFRVGITLDDVSSQPQFPG
jgi:hypothetical protein